MNRHHFTFLFALIFFVPLFVSPCDAAEKNIILFVTDDEGPTLGCYGDPVAKTPNIDSLAADGARFTHAFATTASCSASRSVILSGLHNHKTGQYGHQHHFHKFASYYDLVGLALPRVLSGAGYRTARCGKYHVAPEVVYQFDQKIDGNCRNAVEMADQCKSFISNVDDDRPFFLYMATCDPHRSGGVDRNSNLKLKPNLFGNKQNRKAYPGVEEVFYDPAKIPVPEFLTDNETTRAELAQYYQSCSRIDAGVGRLVQILKEAGLYEKTLIVFTADHGMAFAGAKTTVYEAGLKVPFVVRNPYEEKRGLVSDALLSHVDITPSLVDFAGAMDEKLNGPKNWTAPKKFWADEDPRILKENRSGGNKFREYQGKSWIGLLGDAEAEHQPSIFASHTFHEIQMYYPMRVFRDRKYKLIWNIAHQLDYPFASDLWAASSWQVQYQESQSAMYGQKTVDEYIHRAEFEMFDMSNDPHESTNLATNPKFAKLLDEYKAKLKAKQQELNDPWVLKWKYE